MANLEHMFDCQCLDCPAVVTFTQRPSDAVCPGCGLRMYLTAEDRVGRYQADGWRPGGIQGYRPTASDEMTSDEDNR